LHLAALWVVDVDAEIARLESEGFPLAQRSVMNDGFVFAFVAIHLAPATWWVGVAKDQGVPDYQAAFAAVFGQGLWTIAGSLVAFRSAS
jgi:xanthine/uracil/vitamin C permease (AzgA family)